MRYKSCKEAESSIHFILNLVTFCCNCGNAGDMIYKQNYNGELIDYDDFLISRNKFRERFINDTIPKRCRTCGSLRENDWSDDFKLSYICLAHRSKCSCRCFYCYFEENKQHWNEREVYNILPAFRGVLNTFPLASSFSVNLVGGECSEYPEEELNGIVSETIKHNGFLNFTTSGLFYSEKIEEALRFGKGDISVSPDSGFSSTYEKIKRVNCFDRVWDNIRKYSEASITTGTNYPVRIKYIIIPGINDNKTEFRAFAEKCMSLKNSMIEISVEYKWFEQNGDKPLTPEMIDFLGYIQSYENKIHIAYVEAAVSLLSKIRTDFNKF